MSRLLVSGKTISGTGRGGAGPALLLLELSQREQVRVAATPRNGSGATFNFGWTTDNRLATIAGAGGTSKLFQDHKMC